MNYLSYKQGQLPIVVDFRALKHFSAKTGIQYNDVEKIFNQPELMEELCYYALISGAKSEGIGTIFNRNDIEDILNENFTDFMQIVMKDVVNLFNPAKPEESKKKLK